MNPATYWQWVIDGTGGVVNMLTALSESDARPTAAQIAKLNDLIERLMAAHDRVKDRGIDA